MIDTSERSIEAASFERFGIQYPLRAIEGTGPPSNIEDLAGRFEALKKFGNVQLVHDRLLEFHAHNDGLSYQCIPTSAQIRSVCGSSSLATSRINNCRPSRRCRVAVG